MDRHPRQTVVVGVDIQITLGVIEFAHLGGCDGVGRTIRGEVELRPAHRQSPLGLLIADAQLRNALHLAAAAEILHEIQRQTIRT